MSLVISGTSSVPCAASLDANGSRSETVTTDRRGGGTRPAVRRRRIPGAGRADHFRRRVALLRRQGISIRCQRRNRDAGQWESLRPRRRTTDRAADSRPCRTTRCLCPLPTTHCPLPTAHCPRVTPNCECECECEPWAGRAIDGSALAALPAASRTAAAERPLRTERWRVAQYSGAQSHSVAPQGPAAVLWDRTSEDSAAVTANVATMRSPRDGYCVAAR